MCSEILALFFFILSALGSPVLRDSRHQVSARQGRKSKQNNYKIINISLYINYFFLLKVKMKETIFLAALLGPERADDRSLQLLS